jgi:hypothetical protein
MLSGALWDDDQKMIVLEEQHYLGHTHVFFSAETYSLVAEICSLVAEICSLLLKLTH